MKNPRLISLLVLRTIREEKFFTFLSVTGIALGIGLFWGVKIASDRAVDSFEAHIQGLNPGVNYEVVNPWGIDFDEGLYKQVRTVEEESFPVIRANGYLPRLGEAVEINGIYTVKGLRFLESSKNIRYDFENFFRKLNGVLITKKFADRHRIVSGDLLRASVYDREYALHVVDILDAPTVPPHMLFMDIGNYQEYFGKSGLLTKIDLSTDEKTARRIQEALPSHLLIEDKTEVMDRRKSLVASFRYNLQFVTLLAVLVGVFLLYNTIFISVIKRRTEIGILRGLGMGKKTVVVVFTIQGLILGFAGSVIGIFLGQAFTYFSIMAVQKTISAIYSTVSVSDFMISAGDALKAIMLGLFVSLIASVIPAAEAAKVKPNESSREGSLERKLRSYHKALSILGPLCIVSGGLFALIDYLYTPYDFPYLAYVGILLFILGCTLISPVYLSLVLKILKKPVNRLFKALGKITVGDIEGSLVAISSALIIALLPSIYSLKRSFTEWLDQFIIADVYIKPASCTSNYCFQPLSDEVVKTVASFPEVEDMGRFRALPVDVFGQKVIAGFGDSAIWRKHGKKETFSSDGEERPATEMRKTASISDYLKVKYHLQIGDEIEIGTPEGKVKFFVRYSSISYSTTSGFIYLDRHWLREFWGLDDATQISLYLREGVDVEQFMAKLKRELPNEYALEMTNNRELRENSLAIFDKSFALTYAIEVIAIVISLIGVLNMLLILVLEKKREISIIRYLGGSWDQIRKIIILSAGIVAVGGLLLGTFMGPVIGMVIIHVINKISFGWEVSFRAPYLYLFILMVLLFITTLTAGIIPSKAARKIDPKAFISFE
jgi:putative ABC transport system permease protein